MAQAIRKMKHGHPINPHDIVERYTCDKNSVPCITNECINCTSQKVFDSWDMISDDSEASESNGDDSDNNDFVTFSMWTREAGKIKKVLKSVSSNQLFQDWNQTVAGLKEHIHRKRVQVESYNRHKAELKKGEALVHVDYSESYNKTRSRVLILDNLLSAYSLSAYTISLFTACVYHNDDNGSAVSESNDHSRAAALTCVEIVLKEIEKNVELTKIFVWSDGSASQFRSRFAFKLLAHYRPELEISWHYNEADHGRSPMDGIGGTLKNAKMPCTGK